jgi:small GTP-binding protein
MERNDDENEEKEPIKVILLGDSGVGKTNIILRYLKNEFNQNSTSTIGTTFGVKELNRNNITYNLNIWDTTGQEMYRSVTKLFIQGSKIVILVYSIDRKSTFESLNFWCDSINEICGENVILAIVANKMDLFDQGDDGDDDFISEEEGRKFAEGKKAIFKSVSAKIDKKGIDSLFDQVLDAYIEKKGASVDSSKKDEEKSIVIKKDQKNNKKGNKKKCCSN